MSHSVLSIKSARKKVDDDIRSLPQPSQSGGERWESVQKHCPPMISTGDGGRLSKCEPWTSLSKRLPNQIRNHAPPPQSPFFLCQRAEAGLQAGSAGWPSRTRGMWPPALRGASPGSSSSGRRGVHLIPLFYTHVFLKRLIHSFFVFSKASPLIHLWK